jgi:hypothetical protein
LSAETTEAWQHRQNFMHYGHEVARKKCPTCEARFFTQVGLDEHVRNGEHSNQNMSRRWREGGSPAQVAARKQTGLRLALLNNARRRRCDECGMVSTPAALGMHLRATGHARWTDLTR